LAPQDQELIDWSERILGDRTRAEHVYGALRGVGEGKVAVAKDWLRYHLYAGASSNHLGERPLLQEAARGALVALGEPAPQAFDEDDEFALKLAPEALPQALLAPHKHNPGH